MNIMTEQQLSHASSVDDTTLLTKCRMLLDNIYDEMILWNMNGGKTPLRQYLGMTPQDYLDFMQDPERWAFGYMSRRHKNIP